MKHLILVVDDDIELQETLQTLLEKEGYAVITAGDGREALEKLTTVHPSLIVLDVMMPVMNGVTFADESAKRGLRGDIPIIVLTAGGHLPERAEQIGANAYISKPFDIFDLFYLIQQIVPA